MPANITSSKSSFPTLLGRLSTFRSPGGTLHLRWSGWCPYCRVKHEHAWHETRPTMLLRTATHRQAHCDSDPGHPASPLVDSGYMIKLDPDWRDEHLALVAEYGRRRSGDRVADVKKDSPELTYDFTAPAPLHILR